MKKEKIIPFLLVISLLLFLSSKGVMAEERSIYVGDLINIRITSEKFTEDELRDKFKEFEIENVKKDNGGYIVTLRSFETGEKIVELGDKEIKIVIKSTLDEFEKDDIFEGNLDPQETGFLIKFKYIFYILLLVFLLTGGITFWRFIRKRKVALLNPYQKFLYQTNAIQLNKDDCFVKMTFSLKEYLELSYSCCIKGKTSLEIIENIKSIPNLQEKIDSMDTWLKESDYYKFTGVVASMEKKEELLKKLVEMVKKIEESKEVEA